MPNCNFLQTLRRKIENSGSQIGEVRPSSPRSTLQRQVAMVALRQAAACFAFLGLSVGGAQAGGLWGDDPVSVKDGPGGGYWVVTIGGYGAAEPAFPGSKDYT